MSPANIVFPAKFMISFSTYVGTRYHVPASRQHLISRHILHCVSRQFQWTTLKYQHHFYMLLIPLSLPAISFKLNARTQSKLPRRTIACHMKIVCLLYYHHDNHHHRHHHLNYLLPEQYLSILIKHPIELLHLVVFIFMLITVRR